MSINAIRKNKIVRIYSNPVSRGVLWMPVLKSLLAWVALSSKSSDSLLIYKMYFLSKYVNHVPRNHNSLPTNDQDFMLRIHKQLAFKLEHSISHSEWFCISHNSEEKQPA